MKSLLTKKENLISWFCQGLAAAIMLQTLFYKFSGAEESIYIFSTLNAEPWGRYVAGILELFASVLLVIPGLIWAGAFLGLAIMTGAILSHFLYLGIEVKEDHGYLFILALIAFFASAIVIFIRRSQISFLHK